MEFWSVAVAGLVGGLAVAMPLGAVGVLVMREGAVHGPRTGIAAACGVAVVDLLYCLLAVTVGATVAPAIERWQPWPTIVAGAVMIAIGVNGLFRAVTGSASEELTVQPEPAPVPVFARFVALTSLNPATLVYFLAMATALAGRLTGTGASMLFVTCVGLASLGWQLVLAFAGSQVGLRAGPEWRDRLNVGGFGLVVVLGMVTVVAGVRP